MESPTATLPGSSERQEVYRQRAGRKAPIFHPDDVNEDARRGVMVTRQHANGRPDLLTAVSDGSCISGGPTGPLLTRFKKNLRRLRCDRGLTLSGLASAARLNERAVARLQAGRRRPSLETAYALASALGVTLNALVEDYAPANL